MTIVMVVMEANDAAGVIGSSGDGDGGCDGTSI